MDAPRRTLTAPLLALLLLSSGCALLGRAPSSPNPPEASPQVYGSESLRSFAEKEAPQAPGSAGGPAPGAPAEDQVVIELIDQNGIGPQGIPVKVSGALDTVALSDAEGKMRFPPSPGTYFVEVVVGCTESVEVQYGENVRTQITGPAVKTLNVVWRARIAPAFGTYPSHSPNWPPGETITLEYDVIDRCSDDRAPPGSEFPTWAFRTSPNLEIVGTPQMRAGSNSKGLVRVRCTSEGRPGLAAFDSRNPRDDYDLIRSIGGLVETNCAPSGA